LTSAHSHTLSQGAAKKVATRVKNNADFLVAYRDADKSGEALDAACDVSDFPLA
jgi:hypothetical protein